MCARSKKNICDTPESEAAKSKEKKYVETPLMKQYYKIKAIHPDAILLFRVGDFYETFGEDAIKASGILGITLTRRANGAASYVELAGFPYHASARTSCFRLWSAFCFQGISAISALSAAL